MSETCRICRRPLATQEDDDNAPDEDPMMHLCWRELNDHVDCYAIEERLRDAAVEMRDALEYQDDLSEWIQTADVEDPMFDETLRMRLETASAMTKDALAKAKGEAP